MENKVLCLNILCLKISFKAAWSEWVVWEGNEVKSGENTSEQDLKFNLKGNESEIR